jgi:hypothetical protein
MCTKCVGSGEGGRGRRVFVGAVAMVKKYRKEYISNLSYLLLLLGPLDRRKGDRKMYDWKPYGCLLGVSLLVSREVLFFNPGTLSHIESDRLRKFSKLERR